MQTITNYYHVVQQPSESLDFGQGSQPSMTPQIVQKSNKVLVLRLTTQNTPHEVVFAFREAFPKHKWIVSVEKKDTPDQHYHAILDPIIFFKEDGDSDHGMLDLKNWRRTFLEDIFPTFRVPIAAGNKGYSLSWNTGSNIFPYTLKDGEYWYNGYKNDEIKSWKDQSYRKYVKDEFSIELEKIRVAYMTDSTMTIKEATEKYIKLKIQFRQTLNTNNIKTFVRGWYYAKNYHHIERLAENICYEI